MGKALLGILSVPVSIIGIIDILNIKGMLSEKWINLLGIDKENGMYYWFSEIVNKTTYGEIILCGFTVIFLVIIGIQIVLFILDNLQERLLIIEHNSINQVNFKICKEDLETYNVKHYRINQYDTFNNNMPLDEKINLAISDVEGYVNILKEKIRKGYTIGYAGIANIPAAFMLGYELGDENKKKFFHIYHGNNTPDDLKDDRFHLLKVEVRRHTFELYERENDPSKEGKILLLIQLTQPIKEADIQDVLEDNDYILKYQIPQTIDYDIVDSDSQLDNYTNNILSHIAEIQKNPNIKQIKICVAASGAFVFALGTKFSKTQNKETVIFHYQKDTYPWGINVTKKLPVILKEI